MLALPVVSLLGPLKAAWHYRLSGEARVLAVNFTLAGFYCLFRLPIDLLSGNLADPNELGHPRGFAALGERLRPLQNPDHLLLADFSTLAASGRSTPGQAAGAVADA